MEYIIIIYAIVLAFGQFLLGYIVTTQLMSRVGLCKHENLSKQITVYPHYWVFGLLLHLSFILILKSLGINWLLSTWLPLLPLVVFWRQISQISVQLWQTKSKLLNIPFLVWLVFQVVLGFTLFNNENGISTPWVNNYGDLTFHLGMIHNFVFQGEFPPEYHVYAGEALSYPFMVNLWTAVIWSVSGDLKSLSLVFMVQWVLLWSCAYYFLSLKKAFWLPWLLFFGGGSYFALVNQPDLFSWNLIYKGYPWTTWLSTIWVTQRSALMGLTACMASASLILSSGYFKQGELWKYALAGGILAMTPLVHTHYFLFTALFLGAYLSITAATKLPQYFVRGENRENGMRGLWTGIISEKAVLQFFVFFVFTCFAVVYFPFILGKSGMAGLIAGWNVPLGKGDWKSFVDSIEMWLRNAPQWFVAVAVLWFVTKKHIPFLVILGLFVIANLVKLASWEWDQLKVFLVIFTMFTAVWASYIVNTSKKIKMKEWGVHGVLALLLLGPGLFEAIKVWQETRNYQVYDPSRVKLAELIREVVPKGDIIASPPDHNSAATISGRRIYFGYPGTLASHDIQYRPREIVHQDLNKIRQCKNQPNIDIEVCPKYIIWGTSANKYWHRVNAGEGYEKVATTPDGRYTIYKLKEN